MRIVVCGAGSTGLHVARILAEVHDVTLVERIRGRVPDDRAYDVTIGDAADPAVLLEAGARDADAVVAVTGDDPANLLMRGSRSGSSASMPRSLA